MKPIAFNDGILDIFSIIDISQDGSAIEERLELKYSKLRFAKRLVGVNRFNLSMQNNIRIDMLVRTPLRPDINTQDIVFINALRYRIIQLQHVPEEQAMPPCLDMSLELVVVSY